MCFFFTFGTLVEGNNYLFQERERLVYVFGFVFYYAVRIRFVNAFASSQVNHVELAGAYGVVQQVFNLDMNRKYAMGPTRIVVHGC